MFTAKFIKNIFLEEDAIKAIGRSGQLTKVFAQQGTLDGACGIYSLMMMLIFHKKLDWEDLMDCERAKGCEFVGNIQGQFLYGLDGLCYGGDKLQNISDRVNQCYCGNLSEVFTTESDSLNTISRRTLHQLIKKYLDERKPVMIGYSKPSGPGHALVAIAYRREAKNRLRLFCLDPSHRLPFMQLWNTVIDLDYLSYVDDDYTDTNCYAEKKVCVHNFLVINEFAPSAVDCPF